MMLTDLAQHYGKGPRSLTDIASHLGLSVAYLEQIVPALRAHGLIESQRGAKGGYVLTQVPTKIRMGSVIRALEERKVGKGGNLSIMPCASLDGSDEHNCDLEELCTGPVLWRRVRDAVTQALDSTTLADLVPTTKRQLPLLAATFGGSVELVSSLASDEAIESIKTVEAIEAETVTNEA